MCAPSLHLDAPDSIVGKTGPVSICCMLRCSCILARHGPAQASVLESSWPELPAQSPDGRVTLEFKGNFSSLWQRNNVARHLPRESLRGIRAVMGLVFLVVPVPRRIGKYPRKKEAPLFKLNNSLLVGKGLINPSWRKETKFPLLPHSNLILWHEFLTWVPFLPRLVAPGRGWLFKTAGSSSKAYNLMINAYRQLPLLAGPSTSLIDSPGDLQKNK